MSEQRRTAVVIGGGISGLVAARALGTTHNVVMLEATERCGGKIETINFRGLPLDVGPDAFITRNQAARTLCTDLGLADALISPSAATAALFTRGALYPFPDGLVFGIPTDLRALARSGVVSTRGALRACADLVARTRVVPKDIFEQSRDESSDPTVAKVFRRRLGDEILAVLIDPLIGGINASDVTRLSLSAAIPQIAKSLAGKRSILRALRPSAARPAGPRPPIFASLEGGLGTLVDSLTKEIRSVGVQISVGEPAIDLSHTPSTEIRHRFLVATTMRRLEADAVVVAVPAFVAASLCHSIAPDLSRELAAIPYAGVVTASFAWRIADVPASLGERLRSIAGVRPDGAPAAPSELSLPGSGVLVARRADQLITALTFTSTKWPRSANPGEVVIRASLGRHGDDRALALTDDDLVSEILHEIANITGIATPPLESEIKRWPDSFPQYVSGHLARVARIHRLALEAGLVLAGAAYDGIGIPACIESGERSARLVSTATSS